MRKTFIFTVSLIIQNFKVTYCIYLVSLSVNYKAQFAVILLLFETQHMDKEVFRTVQSGVQDHNHLL
jgi:hypothetical protein